MVKLLVLGTEFSWISKNNSNLRNLKLFVFLKPKKPSKQMSWTLKQQLNIHLLELLSIFISKHRNEKVSSANFMQILCSYHYRKASSSFYCKITNEFSLKSFSSKKFIDAFFEVSTSTKLIFYGNLKKFWTCSKRSKNF